MTYMVHNYMIEMFNRKIPSTTSKAYGNKMYKGTTKLSVPNTLMFHCIYKGILLNLINML